MLWGTDKGCSVKAGALAGLILTEQCPKQAFLFRRGFKMRTDLVKASSQQQLLGFSDFACLARYLRSSDSRLVRSMSSVCISSCMPGSQADLQVGSRFWRRGQQLLTTARPVALLWQGFEASHWSLLILTWSLS